MQRLGPRSLARGCGGATLPVLSPLIWCGRASQCNPLRCGMRFKACCAGSQYSDGNSSAGQQKPTKYSKLGMDGFTDVKFNTAADTFLESIESAVDALEHAEVEEISCNGGVLTLETAHHGTYILNKQAPNVQLWLSSPISGPHHYDMVILKSEADGGEVIAWLSDHDGHSLQQKLEQELSETLKTPIKL